MSTKHLLFGVVCLVVAALFSGCDDHLPGSEPNRLRVKSLTQTLPDIAGRSSLATTTTVSSFTYDSQNRLSSIITNPTGAVETSTYLYDAQNRLSQFKREIVASPPFSNPFEIYDYTYNADGLVSLITYLSSDFSATITPTYNAGNQLTGSKKIFPNVGLGKSETHTYTFTGNNLTHVTASSVANVKQTTINGSMETTFTHDTKLNPFYGLFIIPAPGRLPLFPGGPVYDAYTYYGGLSNLFNQSQNNVLSSQSTNTSSTYTYAYNAANLPISRITTTDGVVAETLTYEYESY